MDPSKDLAQSFDSLGVASSDSAINIYPETSPPTAMPAGRLEKVGFLSLPREVRDQIYLSLVVAEDPIQYDDEFESLSRSKTFADAATRLMFDSASNTQIAREARESFYQHNTFLIYTHDIPALLKARVHVMSFGAGKGLETKTTYRTPFEAGAWVRKLAVRVGWHASGGWFTNLCCRYPAYHLGLLLQWVSLRSVIIDARYGAWPYGIPQGFRPDLLEEMNTKWGKEFRIYNDERLESDTRRYTSNRVDLSDILLPRYRIYKKINGAEIASGKSEEEHISDDDEAEEPDYAEAVTEREDAEREESNEAEEEGDYWERQEAGHNFTSEVQAEEGSDQDERETESGEELAQGGWSMGETLIIQAGERLIQSARTGERWNAGYGDPNIGDFCSSMRR